MSENEKRESLWKLAALLLISWSSLSSDIVGRFTSATFWALSSVPTESSSWGVRVPVLNLESWDGSPSYLFLPNLSDLLLFLDLIPLFFLFLFFLQQKNFKKESLRTCMIYGSDILINGIVSMENVA